MTRIALSMTALALTLGLSPTPAAAHKLKLFAAAEGAIISGYAYFNTGSRAVEARVTVAGADGAPLAALATDLEGNFRFEARQRIDHVISIDNGDGHASATTVKAAELPDSLPGGGATAITAAPATAPPAVQVATEPDDLRAFIDRSVSRQIRPLREQLDAWQEKLWLHDVLGGLGVIFGLGGLAYGLEERRRRLSRDKGGLSA